MSTKIAVRIETNNQDEIVVKRVNYNRFQFFGFGSFIWKTKPEEISISQKALDLLKQRVGKEYTSLGDLAGLDMSFNDSALKRKHRGFIFNYGFLGPELNIPLKDVLVDFKFYTEVLANANKSDKTLPIDVEDQKRWDKINKLRGENKESSIERIINKHYQSKEKD